MKITNHTNNSPVFKASVDDRADSNVAQKSDTKKGMLDKFETSIRNSADLNDTIKVPRTIFKGYLAFMVSTTLVTLAGFMNKKFKKTSMALNIASAGIALWGTYSFVRPYLLRAPRENSHN